MVEREAKKNPLRNVAFFFEGQGGKNRRELIFTTESTWGRKAVKQGTPERSKKKKPLSMEILEKKELTLLSNHPSSYHR